MKKTARIMRTQVVVIRDGRKDSGLHASSWGMAARLAPDGLETARKVGASLVKMLKTCEVFGCSPVICAQETLFAVMAEFGILPGYYAIHVAFDPMFFTGTPETWYLDCAPGLYKNDRIYALRPGEVEQEGKMVVEAAWQLSEFARDNNQPVAVAISHGGPLDAAIMMAKRALGQPAAITDRKPGEGAVFVFGGGGKLVEVKDVLIA